MRSVRHWTPRYIFARCREIADHKLKPTDPWLAREAIGLIERLLLPTDVALEFGAGRSTRWIGRRVKTLTSVEHNAEWHRRVTEMLAAARIANVELVHREKDVPDAQGSQSAYVEVLDRFHDASVDFVLVDGMYRNYCARGAVAKIKPGGLLVVDNANWYLPSNTHSPTSRTLAEGPADEVWSEFWDSIQSWRRIWTSSGVTDTLILFKH